MRFIKVKELRVSIIHARGTRRQIYYNFAMGVTIITRANSKYILPTCTISRNYHH